MLDDGALILGSPAVPLLSSHRSREGEAEKKRKERRRHRGREMARVSGGADFSAFYTESNVFLAVDLAMNSGERLRAVSGCF